jgi:hypothetical protein
MKMKFDYLKKNDDTISAIYKWSCIILFVWIAFTLAGFLISSGKAALIVKGLIDQTTVDPNSTAKYFVESKALADKLKKRNVFMPDTSDQCPVKQVMGILGNEVLVNGRWYKAGDKIPDANVVIKKIEPTLVRIEWNGKEQVFSPITSVSMSGPPGVQAPAVKAAPEKMTRPEAPKAPTANAPAAEDPLSWMGVKLSDALRAKFMAKWNSMSDSEKAQWKERWSKLSDEQKQQIVSQMEQNIDKL